MLVMLFQFETEYKHILSTKNNDSQREIKKNRESKHLKNL